MDVKFGGAELAIVTGLLGALVGAIGILWRTHLQGDSFSADTYERRIAELIVVYDKRIEALSDRLEAVIHDRDSFRDIAERAMHELEQIRSGARGRTATPYVPRRMPESHSPATQIAEQHAEVETLRDRLDEKLADLSTLITSDYTNKP